jgi:pimeloyl-ACP methyl ester carboxylesterase
LPYATNAIDGARVYFEDDLGEGAPVVVLGGFLDPVPLVRRAPMARALSTLTQGFRTIFIDHRGHGRSDTPHDPAAYAMPTRVADVVAVLDATNVDAAHMMGLSWGGRLSFGIGEHAPERARSLVVVGQQPYAIDPDGPLARVVGDALGGSGEPRIEPLIEAFEGIAGRYPDDVRAFYLAADPAAMRAAWLALLAEGPVSERLGEWRMPVLLCIAANDADFLVQARRAAAEIPDADLVIVPETDHLGMDVEGVDPVWPAVLRTLAAGGAGP